MDDPWESDPVSDSAPLAFLGLVLGLATALAGCGRHVVGIPVANQRPVVSLTGGPAPLSDVSYVVRLR